MYGYAYSLYNQVPFGRGGIDPAAAAYFTSTGITGATEQTAIDNLVKGLKSDGLWSKMKAVYPFVTDNRNLLGYTENFGNAYWATGSGGLKTPNYATAPDGTTTACRVYNGGFFQSSGISKQIGTYVYSFYVKMTSGTSGTLRVFLDGGFSTTTINVTNSWTRVEVAKTFTAIDSTTSGFFIDSDVLIWHPQLELGSTATTYQPIATTQQAFISSQFKYNLVNPVDSDAAFRLVFNGGWTHSANGATPNGTNGYADTKLNPSLSSISSSSIHISSYLRTNTDGAFCDIGAYPNDPAQYQLSIYARLSNICYTDLGSQNQTRITYANTDSSGYFVTSRTANNILKTFKNNVFKASDTDTNTASIISMPVYIAANNQLGSGAIQFSNRQTAFSTIGDGLLDAEATALYNRVQAFQTALNRQV